jgi:Leucine-rich repeat (LRR) protein
MTLVEASSSSRAVCRECGSTIAPGEPRFGRGEGPPDERRTRWRHLACAAQSMPDALLHVLELGGWRSVPDDDRDELRAMIDRARERLRKPAEPQAARSSSAMAAAAVLEPAHEAERLPPEQARAWVYADALQARGDLRGELLALELAAEYTDDPLRARALQRDHRGCWKALFPLSLRSASLRASRELRLRWVGGFLLGAHPRAQRQLHHLLASRAAAELERIRVEFCTREELERLVASVRAHPRSLRVLELPNSRHGEPRELAGLDAVELLRLDGRFDPALLAELPALRGLSLQGEPVLDTSALEQAPGLELLELAGADAEQLQGLARALPRLRELSLHGLGLERGPSFLAGAERLERLRLPASPLRELGPLPELPRLRELLIAPGNLRLVRELGALPKLERLALIGSNVGELDALAALSCCEHLTLGGTRTTALDPLRRLPHLRSLTIDGGDMRRITGLERLTRLEQLSLSKLANLDLANLATLERLDTLVLTPGGRRPQRLELLAELPCLRRLSAPLELLTSVPRPARLLARIEVLELRGGVPTQALLDELPRLRRLLLPGCDPTELERLAEANPELALFGDPAPRDLLDRRDPFDWRSVGWMPKP